MVIVDTSIWIDYLAGTANSHTVWLDHNLSHREIGLTDLILCEVLQGTRSDEAFARNLYRLTLLDLFDTGGQDLAIAAAKNYKTLRAQGLTVRTTIDCIIATFCLQSGHALLHRDRDFDAFEQHLGLRVVHPSAH